MATINIENVPLFGQIRNKMAELSDEFLSQVADPFEWLDEIYEQAKQVMQT